MSIHDYMKLNYEISYKILTDEDGVVHRLELKDLPGLVVYADSLEEGLEDLEEAKEIWFELQLELERFIPLPKQDRENYSGRITLRVAKSLHKDLALEAEKEGTSLNQYLNYLIQKSQSEVTREYIMESLDNFSRNIKFHRYFNNHQNSNRSLYENEQYYSYID